MRNRSTLGRSVILAVAFFFICRLSWSQEPMTTLLDSARAELKAAKLSEKEIQVRLKILENVATIKAYYPHADGGRPEYRNPLYWKTNKDGSYIARESSTQAIRDLWHTESGIRCAKLSAIIMIKGMIDVADKKRLAELDEMLQDKVIPNELLHKGIGTLFEKPKPQKGKIFQIAELLPGDEVWFDNIYFDYLSPTLKEKYVGQEGHHVFYLGDGKVMDMYSRDPQAISDFQTTFFHWKSVKIAAEQEHRQPKASDFQIKAVRRPIVP